MSGDETSIHCPFRKKIVQFKIILQRTLIPLSSWGRWGVTRLSRSLSLSLPKLLALPHVLLVLPLLLQGSGLLHNNGRRWRLCLVRKRQRRLLHIDAGIEALRTLRVGMGTRSWRERDARLGWVGCVDVGLDLFVFAQRKATSSR